MKFWGTYEKLGLCVKVFLWLLLLVGANCWKTHPKEVRALKSIKKRLIDPCGNLRNWKRGDPCASNWTGIICHDTELDDGYFHVKELWLLNRNLSGSLSPELGRLSNMTILDFMRNNITGTIPKEIGRIASLELLLLSGNQLSGPLPDELGYLSKMDRLQVDENQISGIIPLSFANLTNVKHIHMNNNSLYGQIPPQLSQLQKLVHLLLDNNYLSGNLPAELAQLPGLIILQLDNNNFSGSVIPSSYSNMTHLVKLSIRNCSLQGPIPDWSNIPNISYIDLSFNQLTGSIPAGHLSENITTIDLSHNNLNGTIPDSFSRLPRLQKLSVANNSMVGSIPSVLWDNRRLKPSERLILDFDNNWFSNIEGSLLIPPNITIGLQGNLVCPNRSLIQPCGNQDKDFSNLNNSQNLDDCPPQACPIPYEYAPPNPSKNCFCAAPLYVSYRMKSPAFSDFVPFFPLFINYLSTGLGVNQYQLHVENSTWETGPRLSINLKIFPMPINDNKPPLFEKTEVLRIRGLFSGWRVGVNHFFGPFELLSFTPSDAYKELVINTRSGISKGALAGIILLTVAASVTLSAFVMVLMLRRRIHKHQVSKKLRLSRRSIKIDGVRDFSYGEMAQATDNFNSSSQVGEGGYGKVYRGILADGTVVAIKRAQEESHQGDKEFLTEIQLLSRVHHRNLVSLIGYCDEDGEQMLVYEFMPNGTLRDHLSGKFKEPLSFAMRVKTALGAAKGILYLHTEANPPIFHRDIKSSNILLDSKYTPKVADFGLSRLATAPGHEGGAPYVSTAVKGTPGYLDPEYFLTHKLTDKSDVYSLGVVFIELLTGLHPISHGKNTLREVNIASRSGTTFSMIDQRMGPYPSECVEKFLNLALSCCKDETEARPSMAKVVRELDSIWMMMGGKDSEIKTECSLMVTPPSSSSFLSTSYNDISGNDLVSGSAPYISPR